MYMNICIYFHQLILVFPFSSLKKSSGNYLVPSNSRLWPCYSIIVVAEIRVHAFLILYGRETRHTYYICFHQYRYRLYATFLSLTFTGYEPQNKHRVLHTFRVCLLMLCFSAFSSVLHMSAVSLSKPILGQVRHSLPLERLRPTVPVAEREVMAY